MITLLLGTSTHFRSFVAFLGRVVLLRSPRRQASESHAGARRELSLAGSPL